METEVVGRKRKIFIFSIALFGALLLWMYAIGYDTEISEEAFNGIQVEIIGVNTNGYTVADGENFSLTVDVRLSGTRSALDDIGTSDLSAYVDISTVSGPGLTTLPVTVVAPNGLNVENVSVPNVTLYVDTFTSRTLNIQIEKTFSSEYTIGETTQSLYAVSVYGPESIISTAEAYSNFTLGTITADTIHVSGEILLRDSETKAIISNPYITMSNSTVDVTFTMYGSKTVPLVLVLQGGKYLNEDVSFASSVSSVTLQGPLGELAKVSSLALYCDESLLEEKFVRTVTVDELLAENQLNTAIHAEKGDTEVTYSVEVPNIRYDTVTVPVSRIMVYGLPEDGSASAVAAGTLEITILGPADAIKAYDDDLMTIMVNYETLTPDLVTGDYLGIAEISTGDSHVCVVGEYTLQIHVTLQVADPLLFG